MKEFKQQLIEFEGGAVLLPGYKGGGRIKQKITVFGFPFTLTLDLSKKEVEKFITERAKILNEERGKRYGSC